MWNRDVSPLPISSHSTGLWKNGGCFKPLILEVVYYVTLVLLTLWPNSREPSLRNIWPDILLTLDFLPFTASIIRISLIWLQGYPLLDFYLPFHHNLCLLQNALLLEKQYDRDISSSSSRDRLPIICSVTLVKLLNMSVLGFFIGNINNTLCFMCGGDER